jgi:hypothetical protein
MTASVLTDEQQYRLIDFIKARGFYDAAAIAELFNRMKAGVTQLLTDRPVMSMDEAMTEVYASMERDLNNIRTELMLPSYSPARSVYEASLKRKYKDIYKAERKRTLTNPKQVITALLAGVIFFAVCRWAGQQTEWWIDGDFILLTGLFLLPYIVFSLKFVGGKKTHNAAALSVINQDYWIVFFVLIPLQSMHNPKLIVFRSVCGSLMTLFLMLRTFVTYATLKKGYDEYEFAYKHLDA